MDIQNTRGADQDQYKYTVIITPDEKGEWVPQYIGMMRKMGI